MSSLYEFRYDHDLYPGDLVALEFLVAAIAEEGGTTSYGDSTAVGDFAASTDATLTEMVTDALAFWLAGKADAGSTTVTVGFSKTTPREYFDCFISDSGGGTGTWKFASSDGSGDYITGANYAKALRGWYARAGYDTTVASVFEWLMAFSSNPTYETGASVRKQQLLRELTGEYSPKIALTTLLRVRNASGTATADNGSAYYDWTTVGLMCELLSAKLRVNFADSKRIASKQRERAYADPQNHLADFPYLRGKSGLTYQMSWTDTVEGASRRVYDVVAAALMGLAFREAPYIYQVTDAQ